MPSSLGSFLFTEVVHKQIWWSFHSNRMHFMMIPCSGSGLSFCMETAPWGVALLLTSLLLLFFQPASGSHLSAVWRATPSLRCGGTRTTCRWPAQTMRQSTTEAWPRSPSRKSSLRTRLATPAVWRTRLALLNRQPTSLSKVSVCGVFVALLSLSDYG